MPDRYFRIPILLAALSAGPASAGPEGVVAGRDPHDGRSLLGELNCAACHEAGSLKDHLLEKRSPVLAEVGSRVTPQYLRAYLSDPQSVKPGTPMPDLLHALPAERKSESVEDLVHYLAGLGGPIDQRSSGANRAQLEQGRELYHSVGCVACHQPYEAPPEQKRDPAALFGDDEPEAADAAASVAVPHGDLASKTTVEALAAFLLDPLHVRPSGRMPGLHLAPSEARMIATYLLREQYTETESAAGDGLAFTYYRGGFDKVPDFATLQPEYEGVARKLDLIAALPKGPDGKAPQNNFAARFLGEIVVPADGEYRFWTRSDDGSVLRIDGKVVVDNDGVHGPEERQGRVTLSKGRHGFELGFTQLGGGYELAVLWQPPGTRGRRPIPPEILSHTSAAMIPKGVVADFRIDDARAERGRTLFRELNCASCHAVDRAAPTAGPTAGRLDQLRADAPGGCLSGEVRDGRPKFAFADAQRTALRDALGSLKAKPAPSHAERIAHAMTGMNCFACHNRGDVGGPKPDRVDYFNYEILVELGDEGRLPPPLNGVGAKFTPEGWEDALFSGERYRSYMATRMPNFGRGNVGHLPGLFEKADAPVAVREPGFDETMIDDGRFLIGKQALGCVNCHAWGPYRLQGAEGLDLLAVNRRLKPGWFHEFVLDPQRFKPGTRMPAGWPEGKSFFPDRQDGDARRQIDAVWAYLSAGQKGGIPSGLSPDDETILVPGDEPIVFRTFVDRVGAHTILVGFRQRTHLAFDANRVRTVLAWAGDFVSTKPTWDGRAGQYTPVPGDEVVRFPEGPPFAVLAGASEPWPEDVPRRKLGSDRTPEGWAFLGYRFGEGRVPTFRYRFDGVTVEETPATGYRREGAYLKRSFVLRGDDPPAGLAFRAALGDTIVEKDGGFLVDDKYFYRTTRPAGVREVGGKRELILPLTFEDGTATFDLEVTW